jgi:hypothetical protein
MKREADPIRIFVAVISAALCVVALFALVHVLGDSDPRKTIAKVSSAAVVLLLFGPIGLTGVVLAVRRPAFAWFGYATTAVASIAFVILTQQLWNEEGFLFFGGGDWKLSGITIVVAIACGQVSLLLAWARSGMLVRGLGFVAALMVAAIAVIATLEIGTEAHVSDRVYGVLAILFLLPVALLPLFTIGRGEASETPDVFPPS